MSPEVLNLTAASKVPSGQRFNASFKDLRSVSDKVFCDTGMIFNL
jgi:hypothetical protein